MQTLVYNGVDFSVDESYAPVPDLPVPISHPQTATALMLPLDPARNYTVTVCLMCSVPRHSIQLCLQIEASSRQLIPAV